MIINKESERYNQLKKFVENKLIKVDLEKKIDVVNLSNKEALEYQKLLIMKRYSKENLSGNNYLNRLKTIYQPRNFESLLIIDHFAENGIDCKLTNLVEFIKLLEDEK